MSLPPYAIAVLIDNTDISIDGDFYPNRLDAQKTTVDRLSQFYFSSNPKSQIGIVTMGSKEFGLRTSLTSSHTTILKTLQNIKPGGSLYFLKALKTIMIMLKYCNIDVEEKRVLAFIGGDHGINDKEKANEIATTFTREDIPLDIVIIGKRVPNVPLIKNMCRQIPGSNCIEIRECDNLLSDKVFSSKICPAKNLSQAELNELIENEPAFSVIRQSMAHSAQKKDPSKSGSSNSSPSKYKPQMLKKMIPHIKNH